MKLTAIKATGKEPQKIICSTSNDNVFASITKWGTLTIFGEDMSIDLHELKQANVIAENFDLFYQNLIEKEMIFEAMQAEIKELNKELIYNTYPIFDLYNM